MTEKRISATLVRQQKRTRAFLQQFSGGAAEQHLPQAIVAKCAGDDDWHKREWAPLDSQFADYGPGDPSPRFFGGPRADAPGWDPSLAGPRFDRIDVGSVGTHGVDPVSSFDGAQPLFTPHSSAREYYLLMRARGDRGADDSASRYADYRRRKKTELDREYADYCRDRQACFDRDFEAWRQNRAVPARVADEPDPRERAGTHKAEALNE